MLESAVSENLGSLFNFYMQLFGAPDPLMTRSAYSCFSKCFLCFGFRLATWSSVAQSLTIFKRMGEEKMSHRTPRPDDLSITMLTRAFRQPSGLEYVRSSRMSD
jgi:hypothetical protein